MAKNYKGYNYIGQVIRILSPTTIIINAGEMDLTVGDKVQIYTVGDEIKDLDDNFLGVYENIKDTLDVVQTSENYSVCEKMVTTRPNALTMILGEGSSTYKARLNVDESQIKPLEGGDKSTQIQLGDYVKKY